MGVRVLILLRQPPLLLLLPLYFAVVGSATLACQPLEASGGRLEHGFFSIHASIRTHYYFLGLDRHCRASLTMAHL